MMAPPPPDDWVSSFVPAAQSQVVDANQGYASGVSPHGTPLHYFFATTAIYLSRTWESLDEVASNHNPLPQGTTHLGAGDYSAEHVYDVAEHWTNCSSNNGPIFIVVFDSTRLQMEKAIEITHDLPEASGIAIDSDTGEALVSSFCDADHVYVYRMSDWTLTGTIPLALPVCEIQGMSWRGDFLYIAGNSGGLYAVRLSDRSMRQIAVPSMSGEYEGLDFHSEELRWLVNRPDSASIVYEYAPLDHF
ncbi:MAG TPA: hypothetical protein VHX13_05465 [Acidobacteriaceae bacterium]|jgi:hypothetical protein|nr:hypothetical protein [Acidobacteriaceae bacterium]